MKKIIIIGGGNMGEAIFRKIRTKFSVFICETDAKRRNYLKRKYKIKPKDFNKVFSQASAIILAVKPQNIDSVLEDLKLGTDTFFCVRKKGACPQYLIISIAAGIPSSYIEKKLGGKTKVIRTMPNMPAQIGEGITAISKGKYATTADVSFAKKIFSFVGKTVVVKEKMIDAVTAVSGSGPAYVFLFVECMMKAARSLGFKESEAKELVYSTLLGSSHLLAFQEIAAKELRKKVTSKGGTTQAAISVFEKRKIERIYRDALGAAAKRAKQLSRR